MINEYRFDSRQKLLDALYKEVEATLIEDLSQSDQVSLLLSGGSTPGPLYERLSAVDLDWSRVSVGLVDERWVDADHDASNERLLNNTLLKNFAKAASFTGMKNAAATPFAGEVECQAQCATLPAPYSLCLLGMGPDAHTASLFPSAEGLAQALDSDQLCAAIQAQPSAVTGDYVERMSLTPKAILKAKKIVLLITGEDKWRVYCDARGATDVMAAPVSLFLQQEIVDIDVYWAP
ncbi:MAG: 6-phosphogluconolactonase [Cellvibrionaceae bacterium]